MSIDPRLPVLIGGGQTLQRTDNLDSATDPVGLMAEAGRAAATDAGIDAVPDIDSVRVVGLLSWRYGNPARLVADELGVSPREFGLSTMGGNSPQTLVNTTAEQIQRGELDVALLAGAETWRTRMRARKQEIDLDWRKAEPGDEPTMFGSELEMNLQAEIDRGIVMPIQVYPIFETALRAAAGRSVDEHQRHISELWSRFSQVAANNQHAWITDGFTPDEIGTPSAQNRMVGLPYTKRMNSNNDVDMGAAVLMCSVEAARRLGVPEDRWVFVHAGTDCHEHPFVSHRDTFARTPAVEAGGRQVLELAGATIDDIGLVDLYSCFPSAVQLGAASLGLSLDRQLTRTGGLAFAGGPWNNYVMHSIATMITDLRKEAGELGLVWANGGYATKHAFGVYSTRPPEAGFRRGNPQAEIDALPRRELAAPAEAEGPATIEGYTVMHDRDQQPELAIASCLLADGRRAWGTAPAPSDAPAALCEGEWVGAEVRLDAAGALLV